MGKNKLKTSNNKIKKKQNSKQSKTHVHACHQMQLSVVKRVLFLKVVGYSRLPVASNEDGHLSLEIKKKESEVRAVQQGLVDALHKCLGSKPTLMVCIEGIKPLPDDRYEVFSFLAFLPQVFVPLLVVANIAEE